MMTMVEGRVKDGKGEITFWSRRGKGNGADDSAKFTGAGDGGRWGSVAGAWGEDGGA